MQVKKLIADASFREYVVEKDEELQIPACGKFAIVQETPTHIQIASDRIRSVPVFYAVQDDRIFIADDAQKIAIQMTGGGEKSCKQEFLASGYVTGNKTLFHDVFTLLPGETVKIAKDNGAIEKEPYFMCEYTCDGKKDESQYIEEFDRVLVDVFKDLISTLHGRTAVVPLSGGCDSRTVAVMLKRLGYEKVICFSYGRKGNFESERSKAVATALDLEWHFVEYNSNVWTNLYNSEDYKDFLAFSCRGSGIGCVQALPAILELKRKCLVPDDAVVVPGHALDFIAGSHLMQCGKGATRQRLLRYIHAEHYNLRRGGLRKNLADFGKSVPKQMDEKETVCIYQQWEWINRQSKFIANDVRTYEFAGYDYELPFWDERVIMFWSGIPARLLCSRALQYAYTAAKIDSECGLQISYPQASPFHVSSRNFKEILKTLLFPLVYARRFVARLCDYHHNSNDFYGFMSFGRFIRNVFHYGAGYTLNTKVSEDTVSLYEVAEKNN